MKTVRWGIVATGWIADKFAEACAYEAKRGGKSVLAAVASRDAAKAAEFARARGIPRSFGSYERLIADPGIDAVYVATPHNLHVELSVAALRHGKAVLCEKPVAITGKEFAPVVDLARSEGLFFMEAMWMSFNPSVRRALEWVAAGRIGAVKYVKADFFLESPFNPTARLWDPALGGGALLDVGIYPVTFACQVARAALAVPALKRPDAVHSLVRRAPTGVDSFDRVLLRWDNGPVADLSCAIDLAGIPQNRSALVVGENGSIELPLFWMAQEARLLDRDGKIVERVESPFECNGYEYEIREAERSILCSETESPVQTWADSCMVMELLDTIRTVAHNA
jgi:dihydrodiol dehydrogenase / D-xylose 1-dehydrogenase (NADP)